MGVDRLFVASGWTDGSASIGEAEKKVRKEKRIRGLVRRMVRENCQSSWIDGLKWS